MTTIDPMDITHVGDYLAGSRFQQRQIDEIPAQIRPSDVPTAYAIQEVVVDRLLTREGGQRIGYKIACTSKGAQELLHVDAPLYGQLLSTSTYAGSSHAAPTKLQRSDFNHCVIEAEFAFRMASSIPAPASSTDSPYTAKSMIPFIESILPGIEIVNYRFTDWTAVGAPSIAADNAIHGAWVYGTPVTEWQHLDLAAHEVKLLVNGDLFDRGSGAAVLGNPLSALAWLANELPQHGKQLQQGDAVTTGVCMDVYFAQAGDQLQADFGELGKVLLDIG